SSATSFPMQQGACVTLVSTGSGAWFAVDSNQRASEALAGISRFATLAEVISGASGAIGVSPSYLKNGFASSFGANGYIKLPDFLGGFMIQWATSAEGTSSTDYRFFPTPFTTEVYGAFVQLRSDSTGGFTTNSATIVQVVDATKYLWNAAGTFGGGGVGFMIAIGR
ncbi:gp53-like domain-containing protein, partial [Pseudomonas veronii]|uniref:gp53-like domain-containing protein n=1 Tax=Pseudomonas veronii TaxID=76761 RepID=UPI00406B91C6